ncbi:MAG: thioredoxin domain-containing protein [Planctomycetota bacterium]|jgi:thiol-disulfide isomerase/thioredoxin
MDALSSVALCLAVLGGTPDGVVLDFSAKWCGPCRSMEPIVHRLQREGHPIHQIDADASPAVLQRYGVTGLPTFVLIVRGKEVERISGRVSESTLRRMLDRIPDKPAPKPVRVKNAVPVAGKMQAGPRRESAPAKLMAGLKSLIKLPLPGPGTVKSVSLDESPANGQSVVIRANSGDEPSPRIAADPLQVCTRIRVRDSHGLDVGSGTIIHSEPGRTLILTCGHLFRHFDSQGQIKVDIFGPKQQTLDGTLIRHNLDEDIGLISASPLEVLPSIPIASRLLSAREHVFSVGCGGGETPTKLQHLVTSTTKYRDFIECTGAPIQGRSGGGLFTKSGELAGVCVFADPAARRGLYAGQETISRLLEQCGLSWLDSVGKTAEVDSPTFEEVVPEIAEVDPVDEVPPFVTAESLSSSNEITAVTDDESPSPVGEFDLDDLLPTVDESVFGDTALTSEIQKQRPRRPVVGPSVESLRNTLDAAHGAEVVCIVRDRTDPEAPSRIVVINRASQQFVADLTGELAQQVQPTSRVIPARRTSVKTETTPSLPAGNAETRMVRYRRRNR